MLVAGIAMLVAWSGQVAWGQYITYGPVVGGVTAVSARFYIQTEQLRVYQLELATDSSFSTLAAIVTDSTRANRYGSRLSEVTGLEPFTKYWYRYRFEGVIDSLMGSFYTFPQDTNTNVTFRMVVGSCNYNDNFPLFESIKRFEPHLFIHLGDWNYPPSSPGQGWDYNLDPAKRARSFQIRYSDNNMKRYVFPYSALDFIYDDDWSQNGVQGTSWPNTYTTPRQGGGLNNHFETNYMDSSHRVGAIRAYFDYFPGYPAVDTAWGIFHRIPVGLADIFVTDVRTSSTPQNAAYQYDSTAGAAPWKFQPEALGEAHTLLGPVQRNWLLDGLRTSGAPWRFAASGVVFNTRYREFMNLLMALQNLPINGFAGQNGTAGTVSAALAYNWAAYPVDHQPLLDLARSPEGRNIVFLSGDSHSSAIDDGTNAGMPELMASGLAAGDEGFLNHYINRISRQALGKTVREILWNKGGNGVDNENFADTYTTVEIFGKDSLRLRVIDELDQLLATHTILRNAKSQDTTTSVPGIPSDKLMWVAFPNPARDRLSIRLNGSRWQPVEGDACTLIAPTGQVVRRVPLSRPLGDTVEVSLAGLPVGVYVLRLETAQHGIETRKVMIRPLDEH